MDHILLKPGLENFEHYFTKGGSWEERPYLQGAMAARAQEGLEELSLGPDEVSSSNSMKLSHAVWGHPRWAGHGGARSDRM